MKNLTALFLITALGACGLFKSDDRVLFDGLYFPTKASSARSDRQVFTVTVRNAARSLEGAQQAGEYQGIKHCIEFFGTSDIDWAVPVSEVQLSGDSLSMSGQCRMND